MNLNTINLPLNNHTLYTGGHFMLTSNGPNLNPGTIFSFQKAAHCYAQTKKRYKKTGLGILINDIGAICSPAHCTFTMAPSEGDIKIPPSYLDILNQLEIPTSELIIFREKHIRNRSKKILLKELRSGNSNIVETADGYTYQVSHKVPLILTRRNSSDKYGTPACPLIMSAYCMEQKRLGFEQSINIYYVGKDNYSNISNHYAIEKGRHLADCFGVNLKSTNIYLFDDGSASTSSQRAA